MKACLEAIANQAVPPHEVIVVDNNSTDGGMDIAKSFSFVKIVAEARQHQSFAQAKGFDCATGDILARIDADVVLPENWVQKVTDLFNSDSQMVAFSGTPMPYDIPAKSLGIALFHIYHSFFSKIHAGHALMWGSNCAFRGKYWSTVRSRMHLRSDIWEDYDLAFALAPHGAIRQANNISVGCSFRVLQRPIKSQLRYHFQAVRAFKLNTTWWRTALQAVLRSSVLLFLPAALIYKCYQRGRK